MQPWRPYIICHYVVSWWYGLAEMVEVKNINWAKFDQINNKEWEDTIVSVCIFQPLDLWDRAKICGEKCLIMIMWLFSIKYQRHIICRVRDWLCGVYNGIRSETSSEE